MTMPHKNTSRVATLDYGLAAMIVAAWWPPEPCDCLPNPSPLVDAIAIAIGKERPRGMKTKLHSEPGNAGIVAPEKPETDPQHLTAAYRLMRAQIYDLIGAEPGTPEAEELDALSAACDLYEKIKWPEFRS